MRILLRASRHAGATRARAGPRPRWNVPRHRLLRRRRLRADTLHYLRAREQVTTVYVETTRQIQLEDHARRRIRAVCYLVDRSHVQYAGRLTLAESLHHVRQGHGKSGANRDYVLETVRALETLGYRESDLHLLAERLKSQGAGIN